MYDSPLHSSEPTDMTTSCTDPSPCLLPFTLPIDDPLLKRPPVTFVLLVLKLLSDKLFLMQSVSALGIGGLLQHLPLTHRQSRCGVVAKSAGGAVYELMVVMSCHASAHN